MRPIHYVQWTLAVLLSTATLMAQPANPPVGGNWSVVNSLTDDFSSFNNSKWTKRNHDTGPEGHRWAGRKPGKFYTSQSTVQSGRLRITATAEYDPGNEQTNCNFWIRTGFVYSDSKMQQGWYTECSMRASDLSMASSFWLKLGTINNQEIDVTETYGNGRNTRWWDDKIRSNTHFFEGGRDNATNPPPIDVADNSAGFPRNRFYRVGMHWRSATQMDIYVDGVKRQTMTVANNKRITEPLRLIWDMEPFVPACGSGPGAPDYEHIRPSNPTRRNYMEVEWVKTWRPAAGGGGGGGQSIANGTYNLKNPGNGQNLGAFSWNGHDARMINAGNFADQKWDITHLGNNVYTVRNVGTGRYLEVPFARCGNGQDVKTWTSSAGNHQRWYITRNGGLYNLQPNHCRSQGLDRPYGRVDADCGTYAFSTGNGNLKWRIVGVAKTGYEFATPIPKGEELAFAAAVSPNPAHSGIAALRVLVPEEATLDFALYDISGRLLGTNQQFLTRGKHRHLVSELFDARLTPGVYLLRTRYGTDVHTERIVIY